MVRGGGATQITSLPSTPRLSLKFMLKNDCLTVHMDLGSYDYHVRLDSEIFYKLHEIIIYLPSTRITDSQYGF